MFFFLEEQMICADVCSTHVTFLIRISWQPHTEAGKWKINGQWNLMATFSWCYTEEHICLMS